MCLGLSEQLDVGGAVIESLRSWPIRNWIFKQPTACWNDSFLDVKQRKKRKREITKVEEAGCTCPLTIKGENTLFLSGEDDGGSCDDIGPRIRRLSSQVIPSQCSLVLAEQLSSQILLRFWRD